MGSESVTGSWEAQRPASRAQCRDGARPCPYVSCRYHLYLDVNPETGTIKFNFPDKEIWELPCTCALDLAERGALTFEQIGRVLNLTRERIRQMTRDGVDQLFEQLFPDGDRAAFQPFLAKLQEFE